MGYIHSSRDKKKKENANKNKRERKRKWRLFKTLLQLLPLFGAGRLLSRATDRIVALVIRKTTQLGKWEYIEEEERWRGMAIVVTGGWCWLVGAHLRRSSLHFHVFFPDRIIDK